jgi:hypothetical protein
MFGVPKYTVNSSIIVHPYVLSLLYEDVHFFCDFFKLRFHIIPYIKVKK